MNEKGFCVDAIFVLCKAIAPCLACLPACRSVCLRIRLSFVLFVWMFGALKTPRRAIFLWNSRVYELPRKYEQSTHVLCGPSIASEVTVSAAGASLGTLTFHRELLHTSMFYDKHGFDIARLKGCAIRATATTFSCLS